MDQGADCSSQGPACAPTNTPVIMLPGYRGPWGNGLFTTAGPSLEPSTALERRSERNAAMSSRGRIQRLQRNSLLRFPAAASRTGGHWLCVQPPADRVASARRSEQCDSCAAYLVCLCIECLYFCARIRNCQHTKGAAKGRGIARQVAAAACAPVRLVRRYRAAVFEIALSPPNDWLVGQELVLRPLIP